MQVYGLSFSLSFFNVSPTDMREQKRVGMWEVFTGLNCVLLKNVELTCPHGEEVSAPSPEQTLLFKGVAALHRHHV